MPLPENTIKITGLNAGTVKGGSLLATSEPDSSTPPVYSSSKVSAADIADFVANDKNYAELTETSDKTLVGAINEIAQGGGGNTDYVELTQAEYDALEQAGTLDPTVLYFITDGQSGNEIIDDTTTSANKVWSSQKVDSELSDLGATIPAINDSSTASTVVWSGNKINSELATKQDDLSCGQLASVDLDDYKTNGFYWVTQNNVSNKPATNFGYLIVAKPSTTIQIFICFGTDSTTTRGDMYVRFYANNQWYEWVKIASATPENITVTRTNLSQNAGTTAKWGFSVPVVSGWTRMIIGANASNSLARYIRFEENGNNLDVYINNTDSGSAITYDMTIVVAYIRN